MLVSVFIDNGRVSDTPESSETVISETPWSYSKRYKQTKEKHQFRLTPALSRFPQLLLHTASSAPSYGTQPLHWHKMHKKLWMWKNAIKGLKTVWKCTKKCYNLPTSRQLVSTVCLSPSCLQADWCLQGTALNSDKHSSCRQLNQFESHIFRSNFLKLVVAA